MKSLARAWFGTLLFLAGGCQTHDTPARTSPAVATLNVGFGSLGGTAELGLRQVVRNQAIEPLVKYDETGRPIPFLAERWALSDDGLKLTIQLKPVVFHDGTPLTASDAVQSLQSSLPRIAGPLYDDVAGIEAVSDREIAISFKRRTTFAIEALDIQITKSGAPDVGTGPFSGGTGAANDVEMKANERYHLGRPAIDRLVLKSYPSARSAWADLLRGGVDMLYEVGVDAIDSLQPSSQVKLYSFKRHYVTVAVFNMRHRTLQDAELRRKLNRSVDRDRLVAEGFGGLGRPATGPLWPEHWANAAQPPLFEFAPERVNAGVQHLKLKCIFPNVISERLALMLQRQLQSVGVDLELESLSLDEFGRRLAGAEYDVVLTEVIAGPGLMRPYLFWHSNGPYNYGGFNSPDVDAALDRIRRAANDDAYRESVATFQQAIANDPPAIFLAWSERARAVSTVFDVAAEPGRDIVYAMHLWRPAGTKPPATN